MFLEGADKDWYVIIYSSLLSRRKQQVAAAAHLFGAFQSAILTAHGDNAWESGGTDVSTNHIPGFCRSNMIVGANFRHIERFRRSKSICWSHKRQCALSISSAMTISCGS